MNTFPAAVLWLVACIGGCAATRQAVEPAGPHFSLLTYNVNYGMPGAAGAIEIIREADADVVCLQEVNEGWERLVRSELGEAYPHIAFRNDRAAGGLAFLSRRPIEELAWVRPWAGPGDGFVTGVDGSWFPAWLVRVQTLIGDVQVMNVHLRPPISDGGSVVTGYYATKPVRRREIEALASHLHPGLPAIVAGDFNEDDDGRAVVWLRGQGYTNALAEFDRRTPTWRWRTSVVTLKDRLDHVMHSDELRCYSAEVLPPGGAGSDHLPVVAVFGTWGDGRVE